VPDIFVCPFCHLRFSLRTEFQSHLQLEHPDKTGGGPNPRRNESDR
jgi:hypothetical protein